ncbi:MAG: type 1 glutamine amidotransferase domain-containing protein [Candidatus Thiodiazotropha sp. (ex Lucinoma annulata)]|nr:type 1 glutamine amidotransferase domain-containing protein [Candidatus Thiodiazotropha sp. (ex Lucinoma annulata)]
MHTIKSILIIVTSFSEIAPGEPTGLWLEEFAVPYIEFKSNGFEVSVASVQGGKAPIDPRSNPTPEQKEAWAEAIKSLGKTAPVTSINPADFDAVFIPGGHGTMFDFPRSTDLNKVLKGFAEQDKVIAAMCHGPASLVGVTLEDGTSLVAGKAVTSFTNKEESVAGFTDKMPFLLETRLRELGAKFVEKPNWSDHVQVDGNLITGQNPQSSKSTALAVINALNND